MKEIIKKNSLCQNYSEGIKKNTSGIMESNAPENGEGAGEEGLASKGHELGVHVGLVALGGMGGAALGIRVETIGHIFPSTPPPPRRDRCWRGWRILQIHY